MNFKIRAYKIVIWILSTVIIGLIAVSVAVFIDGNKKNFKTNLTEDIEILINEKGLNLASIYFPDSLVGSNEFEQKLKLKIGENISELKLKMLASNIENTNAQGDVQISLPSNWEKIDEYYIFSGEIIENSVMEVETKIMLPNLDFKSGKTAIISIVVVAG